MQQHAAALITLRDGRTYAAAKVEIKDDGWVRALSRRFTKTGLNNERTSFYGALEWRSWPREAVEGVKAVKSSAETPEGVSATPCVS
jgi:hypothetical protein